MIPTTLTRMDTTQKSDNDQLLGNLVIGPLKKENKGFKKDIALSPGFKGSPTYIESRGQAMSALGQTLVK